MNRAPDAEARISSGELLGGGTSSGSSGHTCSPATCSGSRLVANTRTPGFEPSSPATSSAIPGRRCSQLSINSTIERSARASRTRSITSSSGSTSTPNAETRAPGTCPTSPSGARSTKYGPDSYRPAVCPATSTARVVLPIPPVPTSVTSRWSAHSSSTAASSRCPADDRVQRSRNVGPSQARRGPSRPVATCASWARIERSRSRSAGPGSRPSSAASTQSNAAVGGEGVGGPSRLVEGEHQLPPCPLAVGVRLDERFQLADAPLTGAAGELGLELSPR